MGSKIKIKDLPKNLSTNDVEYVDALQEAAIVAENTRTKIRKITTRNQRRVFKFGF